MNLESTIYKLAFKEQKELFVFYDSPWSGSEKFPWDYPPEQKATIITCSVWDHPELTRFFSSIGAKVYSTPALIHFKDGYIVGVLNNSNQINIHLNNYYAKETKNNGRANSATSSNDSRNKNNRKYSKRNRRSTSKNRRSPSR
jgi:hypothetical protein